MRTARSLGLVAVLCSLLPFSGCSLMGLDAFDARPCTSDSDCAEAQQRFNVEPDLCGHCVEGLCDWQRRSESCNGADDDCDGLIDEKIPVTARESSGSSAVAAPIAFATARDEPTTTYVAIGGAIRQGFVVGGDGRADHPAELAYASASGDERYVCPTADSRGQDCDFTELALAVDAQHLVYASVNRLGCAAGQLRVGLADRRDSPFEVWLGKPGDAAATGPVDVDIGIDTGVDVDKHCSGKSVDTGVVGSAPPGARSPAVAAISTTQGAEGALVAWLGADASLAATRCSSTTLLSVQALGVHVPAGEADWLVGTNGGIPLELGRTRSFAPPAVAALSWPDGEANYVVGFASEEQGRRGVRVLIVSRTGGLEYRPLAFFPDALADSVILAVGAVGQLGPEVGVAWTTGCEATTSLRFATVVPGQPEAALPPLELPSSKLRSLPQLLYRARGFAVVAPTGGWFLSWTEQAEKHSAQLKLARVRAGASEPLDVMTLVSGAVGYPILLPEGAASLNHALVQAAPDAPAQIKPIAGWCDVRG